MAEPTENLPSDFGRRLDDSSQGNVTRQSQEDANQGTVGLFIPRLQHPHRSHRLMSIDLICTALMDPP